MKSKAMISIIGICFVLLYAGVKYLFQDHLDNLPKPIKKTKYQLYKDHHITNITNVHCYFDTIHYNDWVQSILVAGNDTIYGFKYNNYEQY